ncbi:hypothetical protein NM208_g15276 [Fusarium decemcellulare]|uniref:Uncharacterized protein n=1 Tax=Fusarium decemcellulare TaxID=57161 RepID=A0ACC1RHP8_9HYPO|nr:hypothetical protein NM208_g15276 [Fusarium decemcellulare]
MREPWTYPGTYDVVRRRTSEIQQQKRYGSDLVVLDTEFSPASLQLWEFSIVEKVSGKCLIDTCVKHRNGLNHASRTGILRTTSKNKANTIYKSPRRTTALTADEIAEKLVAAGITPNTIFIVWHYGKADLRLLREFLEAEGHTGILPKNKNCISLLRPYHDNLRVAPRGLRTFPLKLEILFPIFFPRHDLIGLNHRALEDTLQTRLLALAFDELCKPIEEREENWQPEDLTLKSQTCITDFY